MNKFRRKFKPKKLLIFLVAFFFVAPVFINLLSGNVFSLSSTAEEKVFKLLLTEEALAAAGDQRRDSEELIWTDDGNGNWTTPTQKGLTRTEGGWGGITYTPVEAAGTQKAADTNPNANKEVASQPIEKLFVQIFGVIIGVIVKLEGWFITQLTDILIGLAKYNEFVTAPAVNVGWTLVRDIANLFFVLVLLGIAIGTILRIESYNFKKLLPKVLIMAVLVNFSRTIAGLIIDAAQVVMMTFVAAFASVAGGNLMAVLHINDILNAGTTAAEIAGQDIGQINLIVTGLVAVVLLLIAIIVITVMLVVFAMRMIMLWLLVVLSPLAYIMAAFPQGQKYAQQWWQEFSKYVIVGPVLAFFLWLAFAIASTGGAIQVEEIETGGVSQTFNTPDTPQLQSANPVFSAIGDINNMLSLIIGIGMLMGGLMITQQLGVAGGGFAGDMFNRIRQAGVRGLMAPIKALGWTAKTAGKAPFQYAGRKINEGIYEGKLPAWVNPAAMVRGWQSRRQDLHARAKEGATAGAEERWEKAFTGVAQPRRLKMQFAEQAKYASDYKFLPKEKLAELAAQLMNQPATSENLAKRRATVQTAFEQGYDDDLLAHPDIIKKYGTRVRDEATGKEGYQILDEAQYSKFYGDFIGQHEAGLQVLNEGDNVSHRTKHSAVAGLAVYDPRLGKSRMANITGERQLVGKDKDTEEDVYADAYESQEIQRVEYNKEPGRAKLQAHFQGKIPMIKWDDGTATAGRMSQNNREQVTSMVSGQETRGLKEHTTERTVNILMGSFAKGVQFNKRGEIDVTGEQLQNIADIDNMNRDAIEAFWQKIGGEGEARFNINGKTFTLSDIKGDETKDKILGARTNTDWQDLKVPAPGAAPAPKGPAVEIPKATPQDVNSHWESLNEQQKADQLGKTMAARRNRGEKTDAGIATEEAKESSYFKAQNQARQAKMDEVYDTLKPNQTIGRVPDDFAQRADALLAAIKQGLDPQGINQALGGLETVLNKLNDAIDHLPSGSAKESATKDFAYVASLWSQSHGLVADSDVDKAGPILRKISDSLRDINSKTKESKMPKKRNTSREESDEDEE